jgi:hypothetical protein
MLFQQQTCTVSSPPETILRAPSPVYKKAPILGRKDSHHLTLPPGQHLQLPLSLVRARRTTTSPQTTARSQQSRASPDVLPTEGGREEPPPPPCALAAAPRRHRWASPSPPPPSALARCVVGLGKKTSPIPIRFCQPGPSGQAPFFFPRAPGVPSWAGPSSFPGPFQISAVYFFFLWI